MFGRRGDKESSVSQETERDPRKWHPVLWNGYEGYLRMEPPDTTREEDEEYLEFYFAIPEEANLDTVNISYTARDELTDLYIVSYRVKGKGIWRILEIDSEIETPEQHLTITKFGAYSNLQDFFEDQGYASVDRFSPRKVIEDRS